METHCWVKGVDFAWGPPEEHSAPGKEAFRSTCQAHFPSHIS